MSNSGCNSLRKSCLAACVDSCFQPALFCRRPCANHGFCDFCELWNVVVNTTSALHTVTLKNIGDQRQFQFDFGHIGPLLHSGSVVHMPDAHQPGLERCLHVECRPQPDRPGHPAGSCVDHQHDRFEQSAYGRLEGTGVNPTLSRLLRPTSAMCNQHGERGPDDRAVSTTSFSTPITVSVAVPSNYR